MRGGASQHNWSSDQATTPSQGEALSHNKVLHAGKKQWKYHSISNARRRNCGRLANQLAWRILFYSSPVIWNSGEHFSYSLPPNNWHGNEFASTSWASSVTVRAPTPFLCEVFFKNSMIKRVTFEITFINLIIRADIEIIYFGVNENSNFIFLTQINVRKMFKNQTKSKFLKYC